MGLHPYMYTTELASFSLGHTTADLPNMFGPPKRPPLTPLFGRTNGRMAAGMSGKEVFPFDSDQTHLIPRHVPCDVSCSSSNECYTNGQKLGTGDRVKVRLLPYQCTSPNVSTVETGSCHKTAFCADCRVIDPTKLLEATVDHVRRPPCLDDKVLYSLYSENHAHRALRINRSSTYRRYQRELAYFLSFSNLRDHIEYLKLNLSGNNIVWKNYRNLNTFDLAMMRLEDSATEIQNRWRAHKLGQRVRATGKYAQLKEQLVRVKAQQTAVEAVALLEEFEDC